MYRKIRKKQLKSSNISRSNSESLKLHNRAYMI